MNETAPRRRAGLLLPAIFIAAGVMLFLLLLLIVPGLFLFTAAPQPVMQLGPGEVALVVNYQDMKAGDTTALREVLDGVAEQFCNFQDEAKTSPRITGHDTYSSFGNDGHVRVTFDAADETDIAKLQDALDSAVREFGNSHKKSQFESQVMSGPIRNLP